MISSSIFFIFYFMKLISLVSENLMLYRKIPLFALRIRKETTDDVCVRYRYQGRWNCGNEEFTWLTWIYRGAFGCDYDRTCPPRWDCQFSGKPRTSSDSPSRARSCRALCNVFRRCACSTPRSPAEIISVKHC